jgi:GH24 family phage-related lysozyme (muramidase)
MAKRNSLYNLRKTSAHVHRRVSQVDVINKFSMSARHSNKPKFKHPQVAAILDFAYCGAGSNNDSLMMKDKFFKPS